MDKTQYECQCLKRLIILKNYLFLSFTKYCFYIGLQQPYFVPRLRIYVYICLAFLNTFVHWCLCMFFHALMSICVLFFFHQLLPLCNYPSIILGNRSNRTANPVFFTFIFLLAENFMLSIVMINWYKSCLQKTFFNLSSIAKLLMANWSNGAQSKVVLSFIFTFFF